MKNRILSVFCAIAMLATMMSAFVVTASAADAPAITMTVVKQAAEAGDEAEIKLGYEGLAEGTVITGIQVTIPLDTDKFTFVAGSQADVMTNGEITFGARTNSVKFAFNATSESQYVNATSGVLGSFKLALNEGVTAGQTYELVATEASSKIMTEAGTINVTGSASLTTGDVQKPEVPDEPEMPTEAYVYAKVVEQPEEVGGEATVQFMFGEVPADAKITGIQVVMPIDTEKLTFVDGSQADVMTNGEITFGARSNSVKFAFNATSESQYVSATSGVLGSFKLKVADTVAYGEDIKLAITEASTKIMLETGTVMAKGVAGTIRVGAGGEAPTKDLAVELDKTAITLEPGASAEVTATLKNVENTATLTAESDMKDVTVKVDGTKITVTAAKKAADGTAAVTVTAKEGDKTATATLVVTVKAKAAEKPAFKTDAETKEETVAGAKVNTFEAKVAPAEGKTAEEISALITDTEYQVIFDGKTSDGYAAGWAIVTISGDALKTALTNDGKLTDVKISIGGADKVAVSILDSKGNTVVLPE